MRITNSLLSATIAHYRPQAPQSYTIRSEQQPCTYKFVNLMCCGAMCTSRIGNWQGWYTSPSRPAMGNNRSPSATTCITSFPVEACGLQFRRSYQFQPPHCH